MSRPRVRDGIDMEDKLTAFSCLLYQLYALVLRAHAMSARCECGHKHNSLNAQTLATLIFFPQLGC